MHQYHLDRVPSRPGRQKFVVLAMLLTTGAGCAEGETLSADQVMDSMMTAVASRRSRSAIQSLAATAECTGPDGAFETTVTSIRPDTVYFRQASRRGITEIWSTAERTWGGNVGEEYESLTPRVRDFVRGHEFHLMVIDMKDRFSGFELAGREKTGDIDCLRISMKDAAGTDASVCVRSDDWLPAEMQLNPGSAAGPVRIVFDDWRESRGLKLFHRIELIEEPDRVFSYDYVDISVNTFAAEMRVPPPDLPSLRRSESK
jgi:hypothetical protein